MPAPAAAKSRLTYIDWMRGLACLLMFQTHCYDSWLGGPARQTRLLMYSQLGGTFPAPLFLFLAGISFALVTEKLRQKNLPPAQIARTTLRRGAEIFAFGLLFRLQEYLIAWGWAPKSDLLRVDILNTIGLSMMLMAVVCWMVLARKGSVWGQLPSAVPHGRLALILAASATALLIALLTPLLWTTWRPRFLLWPLESYINGVHNLGTPQPWLFPIFPWTAFAFAGLAVGFLLQSPTAKAREATVFLSLGGAGIVLVELARGLDTQPLQIYPVYDFWHTSPNFFLIRLGMLLVILAAGHAWCRWVIGERGAAQWGFSPLIQLGQASLLVYWVHIEFVYGRFSILPKRAVGARTASLGLLVIFLAMLALAYVRTHAKGWINARRAEAQPRMSS
ncbi:MAG TPA: heparan-alpha-glucosaminide N-acetyltransferase domain-containing protein [Candidatus Sulfotelmatobacter sp.]|nr:heparan-alpha-glucosaminide N-acetyltransferase domain-containing protein [Candidatus Sulfotelmatobacter sp.]